MAEAYPLRWPDGWPRARYREYGRFKRDLNVDRTVDELYNELVRLKATSIVISSNLKPRNTSAAQGADPRNDPGVAVYFSYNAKQMSMAQDRFDSIAKNARSLTLAIDAMRSIERHGGGHMMQRSFDGFTQLPPPGGASGYQKKPWREVLDLVDFESLNPQKQLILAEAEYKAKARQYHPDQQGGSAELMAELNLAIEDARQELS